ncbi:hypothetical protein PMAYCL1PPCAC_06318, partial [Pristionchus mayeri]
SRVSIRTVRIARPIQSADAHEGKTTRRLVPLNVHVQLDTTRESCDQSTDCRCMLRIASVLTRIAHGGGGGSRLHCLDQVATARLHSPLHIEVIGMLQQFRQRED